MIVSKTSNRPNSRWLKAGVLLLAVIVLPLGVTYAVNTDNEHDSIARKVKRLESDIFRDDRAAEGKTKDRSEGREKRSGTTDRIDTDGDGKVSDKEERDATLERGAKHANEDRREDKVSGDKDRNSEERQAKLRAKFDTDRDGTISYQEALDALESLEAEDGVEQERELSVDERRVREERQAKIRSRMDTNGDGIISDREERAVTLERRTKRDIDSEREGYVSRDESKQREERLAKLEADTNQDGKISADEAEAYAKRQAKMKARIDTNGDGRISDKEEQAARETADKP